MWGGGVLFLNPAPEWRNWQTRRTQNPVAARPCGFDPLLRDHFFFQFSFQEAICGLSGMSGPWLLLRKKNAPLN